MSPELKEKYPDYSPAIDVLTDENIEVAVIAVDAVKKALEDKGTPKKLPLPSTVAQYAAEISETFPDPNSAEGKAAAEIAITESRYRDLQTTTPDIQIS